MSSMAPLKEFKKERFVLFTLVWNNYDEALEESKLKSLKQGRNDLCVDLIGRMMQPSHILHGLLPEQNPNMKSKSTRSSGKDIYNFYCRTERFRGSPIVFAIDKYNESIG